MSTLPKDAPFIKRFLNGDWGWAHAAQEFGAWMVLLLVGSWLVSSVVAVFMAVVVYAMTNKFVVPFMTDRFWVDREVRQSLKMGRIPGRRDAVHVPDKKNGFWTDDAIADVKFPRKWRLRFLIVGVIGAMLITFKVGFFGVFL